MKLNTLNHTLKNKNFLEIVTIPQNPNQLKTKQIKSFYSKRRQFLER